MDTATVPPDHRNLALPFFLLSAAFFLPYVFVIAWLLSGAVRSGLELALPFSAANALAGTFPAAACGLALLLSAAGALLILRAVQESPALPRLPARLLCADFIIMLSCAIATFFIPAPELLKSPALVALVGYAALPLCLAYLLEGSGTDAWAPVAPGMLRPYAKLVGQYMTIFALMLAYSTLTWVPPPPNPYTDNMFNFDPLAMIAVFFGSIGLFVLVPVVGFLLIDLAWGIRVLSPGGKRSGDQTIRIAENGAGKTCLPPMSAPGPRLRKAAVLLLLILLAAGGWYAYWTFIDASPGKTWTRVTASAPVSPGGRAVAEYKGQLWIIGGADFMGNGGISWHSADGRNWIEEASPEMVPQRVGPSLVVFKDAIFLIGGSGGQWEESHNDVWYSGSGVTWSQIQPDAGFSPRLGAGTAVFHDRIFVIGGNTGNVTSRCTSDVWSSDDGIAWRQESSAAGFPPRSYPSVLVYRGRLWVIGGWDDAGGQYNDVWSSDDGIRWTGVTPSAAFARNCPAGAVVFDDRMWAIQNFYVIDPSRPGSMDRSQGIWTSTDGKTWNKLMASPEFFRQEFSSQPPAPVVFHNRLFVLQEGYGSTGIWYTTPAGK